MAYKNLIAAMATIVIFGAASWQPAQAQGCFWENPCTPTPTPTRTPGPGTPTVTPTPTPPPGATATATSALSPGNFTAPNFGVPTSIPPITFPTPQPPRNFDPIPAPSPFSITIPPIATPSWPDPGSVISSTTPLTLTTVHSLSIDLHTPLTLTIGSNISDTGSITLTGPLSDAIGQYGSWLGDVITLTGYLTGEIAAIQGSETITVVTAPAWYAPAMPRPMADVGWTFEIMTDPTGDAPRITLSSWSSFFGYVSSMPFQMIKSLWQLVAYLGPFGLFLGWLLIMFVIVLAIHTQVFITKLILTVVRLAVRLLELIGAFAPTGG